MHLLCWMTSVSNCVGLRPRWCFWKKWPRLLTTLFYLQRMGTFCQSQLTVLRQGPGRFVTTLTVLKRSWNQVAFLKSHRCFKRLLCRLHLRLRLRHYRRNILSIQRALPRLFWFGILCWWQPLCKATGPSCGWCSGWEKVMCCIIDGYNARPPHWGFWERTWRSTCARSPLQISQRFERQWCTTTTIEIRVSCSFLFFLFFAIRNILETFCIPIEIGPSLEGPGPRRYPETFFRIV